MAGKRGIYIGYDAREHDAYVACRRSIQHHLTGDISIHAIVLDEMRERGLYWREHERRGNQLWDAISDAPMSTQFSITRFLTPILAEENEETCALFIDCDTMARCDLAALFDLADRRFAVQVVQHLSATVGYHASGFKMDHQIQTAYPCKNWSSVMLFNVEHSGNRNLTLDLINTERGRDLHAFTWLRPREIGSLPSYFNHLVGIDSPIDDAALVHFTLGVPSMRRYENCEYADEWRQWVA